MQVIILLKWKLIWIAEGERNEEMINYIEHKDGIAIITQLLLEERLIPIFGSGFSKDSPSVKGYVPDGEECTKIMKRMIRKYVTDINDAKLESYDFSDTAKKMRKSVEKFMPEKEYINFFKNNFTEVKLSQTKIDFLRLPWPFIFTINIDDGIDNTGIFNTILPYQNARKNFNNSKRSLFKLHGDAKYETQYKQDKNIIFDSDQYTQSLIDPDNQTMRENFSTAYKEYNLLFIGCSLIKEPDFVYIYNSILKEKLNTMGIILRTAKLDSEEEDNLEDYGITDVILAKDYDLFYVELVNEVTDILNSEKANNYPFINPKVEIVSDKDLKYFSGYRSFDEQKNVFSKSELIIDRDYLDELEESIQSFYLTFIEGRRFSGKTSLLCTLCEKEKRRTVFFFPSTTQERADVVFDIISNNSNSLLVFDSNSVSSECYFLFQDIFDVLKKKDNRIVIAVNQSDNYLPEIIESNYIKIGNVFSEKELRNMLPKTNLHALTKRRPKNTNLDYLNVLEEGQKIPYIMTLKLPKEYTRNEQILLLLLCVKDKVFSRDINSLSIKYSEITSFLGRTSFLCEWIRTAKGESGTCSTHKLVHNSKNIILEEIRKMKHEDIVDSIIIIISSFRNGDNNQKRIYREVMQFDTLNQLFGQKKGAGKLIFKVYKSLEEILSDDLHFWLQRSKSIYRLVPNQYWKLKDSYSYAKKVYMDSENVTLTTKAALSVSLICSLLYKLEKNPVAKMDLIAESINLGHRAIFSDYYKQDKRLRNDLNYESEHNNYADLIKNTCSNYISMTNKNGDIVDKALDILRKLG